MGSDLNLAMWKVLTLLEFENIQSVKVERFLQIPTFKNLDS